MVECHNCVTIFNYRLLERYNYESGYNAVLSFKLPLKYGYSSGMSSSYAYK